MPELSGQSTEPRRFFARTPHLPLETCPALAALLWMVGGILPLLLVPAAGLHPVAAAAATVLAVPALFLLTPPGLRKYAPFLPLGVLLTLLHLWAPWQSYRALLPRPECGAEVEGVVAESVFAGEALSALEAPPTVQLALERIRLAPEQPWIPCSGTVILRRFAPPETGGGSGAIPPLPYGVRIRASGAFTMPAPPVFPGDFDYGLYLRTLGIRHEFLSAAPEETIGKRAGWRRLTGACYDLRDRALERIAAGLEPPGAPADSPRVQLLAAIIFNYRTGMPPELRTQFLRSGTIHIFSVGGIHVVILGSLLLLLLKLCGAPYRWRYALLPLLLGLYVVMTGCAPPAVRAWVMITFWSAARGWLFPSGSLNSIAAAALFLLLLNPPQLAQTGFIFSFTLVFFLIHGWEAASRWRDAMLEADRWRPLRCRPFWRGAYRHLLGLLSGTLLGWLASAGLIVWFNARLIPASFWVNIGIGATTWCVLALSLLKALLGWLWGGADGVLARLLGLALDATRFLAEAGSRAPGSLAVLRPPLWTVLLFYAALLAALSTRLRPGLRRAAGVLALCLPVAWFCGGGLRTPQLAVFTGGGSEAPAVVLEQPRLPPLVVNSGNFRQARSLAQWLMLRGYDEADVLVLANPDGAKPAAALLSAIAPRCVLQAAPAPGAAWSALRLACAADGTGWRLEKTDGRGGRDGSTGTPEQGLRPARTRLSGSGDRRRAEVASAASEQPLRLTLARRPWSGTDFRLADRDGRALAAFYFPLAEKPAFLQLALEGETE